MKDGQRISDARQRNMPPINVLVTIGNGFDLKAGMKTSYKDFLEYLSSRVFPTEYGIIQNHLVDALSGSYLGKDSLACPLSNSKADVWSLLFLTLLAVEKHVPDLRIRQLNDWKDIEKLILDMTKEDGFCWKEVLCRLDISMSNIHNGTRYSAGSFFHLFHEEAIAQVVAAVLNAKQDLSDSLVQYCSEAPNKGFVSFLLTELNTFEKRFGAYIKSQSSSAESANNRNKLLRALLQDYIDRPAHLYIDSFNYDESWNNNVRYINGDFQKPIFGVDESLLPKDSIWMPFSKGSRRLYLDRSLMSGRLDFVTPDVMIVYGHSLNKQDHAYFFNMFDAMNLTDPTKKTKVCFCYSRYGDKTSEQVKNEMIKLVLKLFEKYDERNARRTVPLHTLTQLEICGRINIKEIETTFD